MNRFRLLITRNLPWKLASLLLAVLAWGVIHSSIENQEPSDSLLFGRSREFELPIVVQTTAGAGTRFQLEPESVKVIVRGARSTVEKLDASQLHAYVDLTDFGRTTNASTRITIHTPPGLRVLWLEPARVIVERL